MHRAPGFSSPCFVPVYGDGVPRPEATPCNSVLPILLYSHFKTMLISSPEINKFIL